MSNWEIKDDRFVLFLDVLGFKDLVARNSHQHVYDKLFQISNLKNTIDEFYSSEYLSSLGFSPNIEFRCVMFSDSLLVTTKNDTNESALNLIQYASFLLSYCFKNTIPVKGAIAHGTFTFDSENSIYFGQPLIDAFELEENLKFLGITIHHTFELKLREYESSDVDMINKSLIKYKTPLKNGRIFHKNIDWISQAILEYRLDELVPDPKQSLMNWFQEYYLAVSNQPRLYIDNTIEYVQYFLDNKDKNAG